MRPRPLRLLAALGAVSLLGSLAACGSSGAAGTKDDPVTITFWDDNAGPDRTPLYTKIISDFEQANPTIKVDYVGVPAASAVTKYQTAVAGGSTPDVGIIEGTSTASLVGQGALVPLDDLLTQSPLDGQVADDSLAAARATAPDKKLYLLPMTSTPDTLWYRSDLVSKAGLKPPTTWDDFYTDAAALTDKGKGQYGFGLRGGAGAANALVPVAYSCSGVTSFFGPDGRTTMRDPKIGQCFQQFADLYGTSTSAADISNGYQEMVTEFDSGKAAMIQHNLGSATNHAKAFGDRAVGAPMPVSSLTHKLTLVSPTPGGPAVFKNTKHQDQAWTFAQYLLTHEVNSAWNEAVGQVPGNAAARSDAWVAKSQPISTAVKALGAPSTVVVSSPLYLPDWSSILNDMTTEWQSVLSKKISGQQFADDWAQKVDAAVADFQPSH